MKRNLLYLFIFLLSITKLDAQMKIGDQPTIQQKSVALDVKGSNDKQGLWLPRVSDTSNAGINGLNPPNGMLIFFTPTQNVMIRRNNSWVSLVKTDTTVNNIFVNGVTRVTGPDVSLKVGNNPGTTNDLNLQGSNSLKEITINLPDASTTARGVITTGAQSLAGTKTLSNGIVVNNGSTLNSGTIANDGLSVTGATTNVSNLTLGVTSATTPATQTDRYLSVNASGNVTLNSLNAITSVTAGGLTMTGPGLTYNTGSTGTDFNLSSTGNTTTWNLPSASTTARGAVTTAAQTFAGLKTFSNGATVNNSLTVSGATTNTSNLTLGITSATVPAAQTDRYLTVNASGNVTLNSLNAITSVTAGGLTMIGPALTYNTGNSGTDFNISSSGNIATWNIPDASTTARGVVTTAAQSFAGLKTLTNGVVVNNGSTLNNGTTANGGLTVSGATTNASNLTLGITSATTPAAQTDRYLTVNASGNVTLNSLNALTSVTAGGLTMTGPALTYNVGTTGTDFNISSSGNTATWNLPSASTTARGAVTTLAQSFAGLKTLTNGLVVNNGSTLNNGTTANGGLTVSGATTNTSNLILGVTSATTPAAQTDRYLSVNASGNVTLNSLNAITSVTAGGLPMTGPALTYNTGTAGTDFNISSSGNIATWNLPDASTSARGAVTTSAQTFAGLKTLNNGVTVNNGATLNNGTTANGGLTVSGATGDVSNLTLGITSATIPTTVGTQMLSVNASGAVITSTTNIEANKPTRVLNYTLTISGTTIAANSTYTVNTPLPVNANVAFPASVYISPSSILANGTTVDWATVLNNNLVANISTRANTQSLNNYVFYVTIVDF